MAARLAYDLEALLSPTIAAALLTLISYDSLFVGTAVGLACWAILVLLSRLPARADPARAAVLAATPVACEEKVSPGRRRCRSLMLTNIVVAAGTAIVLVNSVVYARGVFGLGDQSLALALACYGMGSLRRRAEYALAG